MKTDKNGKRKMETIEKKLKTSLASEYFAPQDERRDKRDCLTVHANCFGKSQNLKSLCT